MSALDRRQLLVGGAAGLAASALPSVPAAFDVVQVPLRVNYVTLFAEVSRAYAETFESELIEGSQDYEVVKAVAKGIFAPLSSNLASEATESLHSFSFPQVKTAQKLMVVVNQLTSGDITVVME